MAQEVLFHFGEKRASPEGTFGVGLNDGAGAMSEIVRALDDVGVTVTHMELKPPSLDDVFAEATGHRLEGAAAPEAGAAGPPAGAGRGRGRGGGR
jgi:ABC-2 type transport system ATP-binding protein